MRISYILLLFIFLSCSQIDLKNKLEFKKEELSLLIDKEKYQEVSKILELQLHYVETIPQADFKNEIKSLLKEISIIDYHPRNCPAGQVACSDQSYPHAIFINDAFFALPALEQFTGLLHEAYHLKNHHFEHTKCIKKPEWGYQCDEDLNSSYGIEYKYILHQYMITKDDNTARLLLKIFTRINKI